MKVTIFRSYCSSLYTSQLWWKYKVNSIRKLYVAYNNAFRMLFMLPRDCSASGMFPVHNVMSCPALVRKLVFGFYKRVKASQNSIVQAINYVHLTSGGSLQLEPTGISCYMSITLARVGETGASCYRGRLLQGRFMQNYNTDLEIAKCSCILIHQRNH